MSSIRWLINVQYSNGGPIIAVQVENEYGAQATDQEYMPFIKEVRVQILKGKKKKSISKITAGTEGANLFPCPLPQCLLLSPSFTEQSTTVFVALLVLFICLLKPLLLQALLSRGVTELLLTSDSSDCLDLGGVQGGIVR